MKELLDAVQAKALDRYTIETFGMQSLILMERAAYEAAACIKGLHASGQRVFILAGTGNNGADGLAVARMLIQAGYQVSVLAVGKEEKATAEWNYQKNLLQKMGLCVDLAEENFCIPKGWDFYVDALFGIGLKRKLEGRWLEAVKRFNEAASEEKSKVIAIDIVSGIDASTGKVLGEAVRADITVTFGYPKLGQYLSPGAFYSKKIKVADIGFDIKGWKNFSKDSAASIQVLEQDDAKKWLGTRNPAGNKGTFGKVLVIAGARGMAGAAYFASEAAYRTGAGLVTILTEDENRVVLQEKLPEAVLLTWKENADDRKLQEAVLKAAEADAIVIGPGLSQSEIAEKLLKEVLTFHKNENEKKPLVIDADALNLLSKMNGEERLGEIGKQAVLTPHMGELSRLLKKTIPEIKEEGIVAASLELHKKYGAVCVCKDARTVIRTEEEVWLNQTGNDGMATGGSGDILAGVIGGLAAQGICPDKAAILGTFLHGRAGDLAAEAFGHHGMLAGDILHMLPKAMKVSKGKEIREIDEKRTTLSFEEI